MSTEILVLDPVNNNPALYFVDRHRSGETGLKAAFTEAGENGRSLTYCDLAEQSDCIASLYDRHELQLADRAVMLLLDTIEFPIIFWGSLKAGVIPVPLNTLLSADIYDAILEDCGARALFVSAELLPVVEPILENHPRIEAVFVVGSEKSDPHKSFAEEIAASEPRELLQVAEDEDAFWLYSSGSTGMPKGVRHVHASLKATADTYGKQVLGIKKNDIVFSAAKLFFAYGLGNAMTFPMSVGATTVLLSDRPTPESVFGAIQQQRPTIFCGVPTLYAAMLASLDDKLPVGLDNIRRCISAGEALPEEIGVRWTQAVGSEILDGVGSTELLHIFLSNTPGDVIYGTSGTVVPGYELRLVDDEDKEVDSGVIGELLVNGPSAAVGYWNQPEKSRATFDGEWTRTGDKYERREDGRLVYCGRTDDMFKVSGIWVSPFEIEQALISHSAVLEAAVVAARDDEGLEKPKAFVVLKKGITDDDLSASLKNHVKQKIGKWKFPRWIEFIDELPKTATGKIQRFKLRDA
ncbi:MAG: benzoate-CoA ligase family protein [Gammaproteobacteria bacterium]|nr:MAG: benzoate-CoA ligase family protein [Gammaproteobacteria bacterium]